MSAEQEPWPIIEIPKEVWDELRRLQAIQNAIINTQLECIRFENERAMERARLTLKGIEMAEQQAIASGSKWR